ncbi:alpha/beta fold hydrolase [Sphingopyxis sp. YF1]|uniref:alpha/beta fold hydrolase n=1 Tax=unclassified Sphingopyxis TaxID=2614943 RepID=UPI001F614680|nr:MULTISPECIES: alpha/beta hydrolase [unclassified Sphingopyxis]UNU44647.1 alpha/beta fold hydrolase [Sphingopyxis sp. YF1]USI76613.1 alpha/beta hydrolase [Sphingopyxis sp. USTB-05]
MHGFLSNDWAGLVLAAGMAVLAGVIFVLTRRRWAAAPVLLFAAAMAVGSGVHLYRVAGMERLYPAPGSFVEVDGQRLHVLAEGAQDRGPVIVLFGGGYAPGTAMKFLHDALKPEFRSVLIDRPGTGWSGPARFPVSTATQAKQMWEALDKVGVKGPVMLAGHSFGGLLAANMARLRPEQVHALVVMDATPPDVILYGPRLEELSSLSSDPWWNGFFSLFALDYQTLKGETETPPAYAQLERKIAATMGKAYSIQKTYVTRPRTQMAAHSIFRELTPQGMAAVGYETGFYEGELGNVPLYLFAPQNAVGLSDVSTLRNAEQREAQRLQNFYAVARERYLDYSNNSTRIVAPADASHNFLYEYPAETADVLRQIARGNYAPPATALQEPGK